ncbi:MAG: hypothetical protein KDA60_20300, partial [Planctomycetales bacterium]|nr:hypothetical protein [Planctomycetales bacterium]
MRWEYQIVLALFILMSLALGARASETTDVVWIEGEDAQQRRVSHNGWYDSVKKEALSGGEWLTHFDEQREGLVEYEFSVQRRDEYDFWIRANPIAARLSYQLDKENEWRSIDWGRDERGRMNIAQDNKPDLRFITWVKVGKVSLDAGKHTLSFRMHSGPQNHGAIDCFVLTRIPFVPSGTT